jgi:hypothetical protein
MGRICLAYLRTVSGAASSGPMAMSSMMGVLMSGACVTATPATAVRTGNRRLGAG